MEHDWPCVLLKLGVAYTGYYSSLFLYMLEISHNRTPFFEKTEALEEKNRGSLPGKEKRQRDVK